MRITQDLLLKFARETVKQRQRQEPDMHAAYLTGSLLSEAPLLGGTTDIDLVLVHKYRAPLNRECVPLTPEISLDISHKVQEDYAQHRQLRQDAHLGYPLTYYHILLFDTDHWLEFIQSSVSADFHQTENVLARVNASLDTARENWFSLIQTHPQTHLAWLHQYFEILESAANAVAGLTGPPLTTRRFMLDFNNRTETLGLSKILAGFNGLLGFTEDHEKDLSGWVNAFESDLVHLAETAVPPVHLAPCRHAYYVAALRSLEESGKSIHASWPLLRTWLDVHLATTQPTPGSEIWESCLERLDLTKENTDQKNEALDSFLDNIDLFLENWASNYGA